MIHYNDYAIKLLEKEIITKFNDSKVDYTEHQDLLKLRKELLNQQTLMLEHQVELLSDIIAFNDALREALSGMYQTARRIYRDTLSRDYGEHLSVTARCYLSSNYPALHPLQDESRQEVWDALCDYGYNPLYEDGVSLSTLTLPQDFRQSFDGFIGLTYPPPNWNEGLDQELTKDLHLISPFHHLFDHTNFALTDFIFVRDFRTEITMEVVAGE